MASPFRFEELPPGFVPPRRLYLRGSEKHVSKSTAFPRKTWYHIGTFTAHEDFIPRTLSSFPKSTACLSDEDGTAYPAVFWSVDLFSGAEATGEDSQPKADIRCSPSRFRSWISIMRVGEKLTKSCGLHVRWDDQLLHRGTWTDWLVNFAVPTRVNCILNNSIF